MRNLLAFVAAVVISFAVVGYYLDWYALSSGPVATGERNVTVDFHTKKIGQDLRSAEQAVEHKISQRVKQNEARSVKPSEGDVPVSVEIEP